MFIQHINPTEWSVFISVGPFIKIPNQFYFNLEATFMDKKETTSFVEYYDHPGLRGLIIQKENGAEESFYYSFETNEIFTVRNCK